MSQHTSSIPGGGGGGVRGGPKSTIFNIEKFDTNQLFFNNDKVDFHCCRHFNELEYESFHVILVVNSHENTCMFKLLLFLW